MARRSPIVTTDLDRRGHLCGSARLWASSSNLLIFWRSARLNSASIVPFRFQRVPSRTSLTTTVQTGTILIDNEPRLAPVIALKSEPYSGNWRVLSGLDGFALDREIRAAGWHFFFIAAEIRGMFFGAIMPRKVQGALKGMAKGP
jgi:hypothetical protein